MTSLKKSLRAKFPLILLFVGLLPLAVASAFFYHSAKDSLFQNVFKEPKWNLEEISGVVEGYFAETGKDILTASRNTAFPMYYLDPPRKQYWLKEQHKTLQYLRGIYPDMLDEACFIDASGKEVSRIVFDQLAHEHDLSSDEARNRFFQEAFKLSEGQVYQGRPVISQDTHRWVLPNATPIAVNGKNMAILHFEVTMDHFQKLLKKLVNPDRGFGLILDGDGLILAHSRLDISETEPFPPAVTDKTPGDLKAIYSRMIKGDSGMESFWQGGKEHFMIFRPLKLSGINGRNDNSWSIAYVIPSERVYVELDILRYNIAVLLATVALSILLSYIMGNYLTRPITNLASATNKVAAGEMPNIEVDREDELGTLSSSFNVMVESIKRRDDALKALAITDGLTGLYNYRYFRSALEKEVQSSHRFSRPLSLIMADVDHFKNYNDRNGHAQGDMALKKVAEVLSKTVREVDLGARYGGEEFVVILPETTLEVALNVAERIRRKFEEEEFAYEELQPGGKLTLSLGVATLPADANEAQELVEAADRALYKAKENGRNQVWPSGC